MRSKAVSPSAFTASAPPSGGASHDQASTYQPPYSTTPAIVDLAAGIEETIGRYTELAEQNLTSSLRRGNWDASVEEDLLAAHELLMLGLVGEKGRWRY